MALIEEQTEKSDEDNKEVNTDSEKKNITDKFQDILEINGKPKESADKTETKLSNDLHQKSLFAEDTIKPNNLKKSPQNKSQLNSEIIVKVEKMGFEDLTHIGFGTYGHVFKAKSVKHQIEVAVKVIESIKIQELFRKKFLNVELELIKQLKQHENIVKFYDSIEDKDNDLILISMEYCPNGDLYDYIERHLSIPERESYLWFKQLISGVEHIHNSGYAHRDLKCENLLLDSNFNIKIIDFGFCGRLRYQKVTTTEEEDKIKTIEKEIPSVTCCGSVMYASPELLKASSYYQTKNDIWSCGIILYFMLFGRLPKEGKQFNEFIGQNTHAIEVPDNPKVSEECKQLFRKILIDEQYRYDIKQIKDSVWFKKEWPPIDPNVTNEELFGELNIRRQRTMSFE